MNTHSEEYKVLEEAALKHNKPVAELAKIIIMEDYANAGYSGNDSWFDQYTDERFIEAVCNDILA